MWLLPEVSSHVNSQSKSQPHLTSRELGSAILLCVQVGKVVGSCQPMSNSTVEESGPITKQTLVTLPGFTAFLQILKVWRDLK